LEWCLRFSDDGELEELQRVAESRAKKGLSTPSIDNAPLIDEDLFDVWNAFCDLGQTRTYGFGPNPIQLTEIETWLRLNEIRSSEDKQFYLKAIKSLDVYWLKTIAEKKRKSDDNTKTRH